jgi:DNA (cytosine-5)-methyltransferase 1
VKAGHKGHRDDPSTDNFLAVAFGGNNQSGPVDVATARSAHGGPHGRLDFETETFVAHALRADGFDASEDGTGRGTPLVPVGVALRGREGGATAELTGEVMTSLRTGGGGGDKPHVLLPLAFDETQITSRDNRCNPQPGDPCHPIAAKARPPTLAFRTNAAGQVDMQGDRSAALTTQTDQTTQFILSSWRVRRLTPVECERLQGFPDGYTAVPYRKGTAADGPRYKALGNSMAVNVMSWIGHRIDMVDNI